MLRPIVIGILCVVMLFTLCYAQPQNANVCIRGVCIIAEIADTDEARARGLMYRSSLADGSGMLFVFQTEAKYAFWMMNMRFPIDIIWINGGKKIVDIKHEATVCSHSCAVYEPKETSLYALEVEAGFCARHGIGIGDRVIISFPNK